MKFDLMNTQSTIQNDPDLTASQKAFLFVAARCTNNDNSKVKNSQENLAHYAQINFKTVSKWLTKHEEVRKYFIMKKRGRMLDLWFKEEVPLTARLFDTLPSRLRDEASNTPSEVEYQTVTEQSQSDTPSEIPNTPSEVEPSTLTSTSSSTLPSTLIVGADAPPLPQENNLEQGEVTKEEEVVVVDSPLDSNSVELPFVSNKSSAPSSDELNSFWDSYLESKEETSAPADVSSNEDGPAREWVDITFEAFEKWLEEASPEEQVVAIYGYDYKRYDSLERIMKTAVESTKPQYDEWTAVATKYAYAEKEVDAPGRDRTKEASVAKEESAGNTTGYNLDEEW